MMLTSQFSRNHSRKYTKNIGLDVDFWLLLWYTIFVQSGGVSERL